MDLHRVYVEIDGDVDGLDREMSRGEKRVHAFSNRVAGAGAAASQGSQGFVQMGKSAGGLTARMAGLPPVIGRVVGEFSSIALGSVTMIGVLGGLAALGLAWRVLTRDMREAKEEAEKNHGTLTKLMDTLRNTERAMLHKGVVEDESRMAALARSIRIIEMAPAEGRSEKRLEQLKAEYAELEIRVGAANKRIDELVAKKIDENAKDHADAVKTQQKAVEDAARALEAYRVALIKTVESGLASAAQIREVEELQREMERTARDVTKGAVAQAEAWQMNVAALKALRAEIDRAFPRVEAMVQMTVRNRLLPIGRGSGGTLIGAGTHMRGLSGWQRFGATGQVFDPMANPRAAALEAGVRPGPAGQQIMQVAQAAASGLGPFALLIPVINSALEALEPVLTKIIQPLANLGEMLAQSAGPQLEVFAKMLRGLAIAFSYVNQALGWLIRGIGKAINFLLPGNPANGLVRFGQGMIDASRAARDFSEQTNAMTASMRNVPLIFDPNYAAFRVGHGMTGRTATAAGGTVHIGTVNIAVDSQSTWAGIRRQMTAASAAGDPLARALLRTG